MIIFHVLHYIYPGLGGLERVVQKVAENQAKLGHKVYVIAPYTCRIQNVSKREIINGVYIYRVNIWKLSSNLILPKEIPQVLKKANVIHVHNQNSLFNVKIAEKAKQLGIKVATHFMAIDTLKSHPNFIKRSVGYLYQKKLTSRAIKITDLFLVKSIRDKLIFQEKYNINPVYVPDGIDEYYFNIPSNPNLFREKYSVTEDKIILYIGRLHPSKGPHVLIKAATYLARMLKGFKIVLVGPGSQRRLKNLAKKMDVENHVLLTGVLNEEEKISAIDASTCVVIPSLYDYVEAFSLVTSEAWARSRPVVASAVGELPFRIIQGKNGFLVPPGNPKILSSVILKTLNTNFKIYENLKSWKHIAHILCSLYVI